MFKQLLDAGDIHPKLTLEQAKQLIAAVKRGKSPANSRQASIQRRLERFADGRLLALAESSQADRTLVKKELLGLIERIDSCEMCEACDGGSLPASDSRSVALRMFPAVSLTTLTETSTLALPE